MRARVARQVAAGLWLLATPGSAFGQAQTWPAELATEAPASLDVPYLPQSELLCGGAALAMVERWWGRRGVQAEDFAALVRPDLGGIRTDELDSAARARGWDTRAVQGTSALAQALLREGVPVIALIEVGRDRYHYVVVLGWSDGRVVFHDPAGAPSTSLTEERFLSRWAGAGDWALIVRPPPPRSPAVLEVTTTTEAAVETTGAMPCSPWLDRALDAAAANQLDLAEDLLAGAARACPAESLVLREMAGIRFKQGRYEDASRLAAEYAASAPDDELGWQLLGTSRYLAGDDRGALEAWNEIDRPVVDLLVITGSRTVRFQQLAVAAAVPHGTVLSPFRLGLAQRRLAAIPALRQARVAYQPVPGGLVEVRAAVLERPTTDPLWRLAAAGLVGGLVQETVRLEVASPTGAGELWSAEWRWADAHPRAAVRVAVPTNLGIPGVLEVVGAWERMRVALDTESSLVAEDAWRSASASFGAWVTPGLQPSATVGLERWSGERSYLTLGAGTAFRAAGDRFRVTASGTHAVTLGDHPSYRRGGVQAMWASSLGLVQAAWSLRLGGDWASENAPLGARPAVSATLSGAIPLRAEPSSRSDPLPGRAVGRGMLHGGLAGDVPVYRWGPLVFAAGAFLDGARVAAPADDSVGDRYYMDGGVGIRIGLGEGEAGVLRIDLARGLVGGPRSALTIGVHRQWPFWSALR